MITNIALTTVFVKDIDASLAFYTDILGFAAKDDITMGDYRWCTVGHPAQPELQIHLSIPGPPFSPEMVEAMNRSLDEGGLNGPGLHVDDCRATYEALTAKGVVFVQEPEERPYGVEALCRDNSGNWIVLIEPREYSPADFES